MKKMKSSTLRALCMLVILVIIAIGYFTKVGIGNLSGLGWDVFSVLCPLGYLESLLASKTFVPRALISFLAIVAVVIVLGRVFCAWICPMPFMQKILPGFGSKKEGAPASDKPCASSEACGSACTACKPNKFKLDSRHGVLLGALGSAAVFGFPVFCLICPVGLTFATVYLVMRLFAFGETTWTVIVVPLLLVLEVVFLRKWCSKICPLGALMSLISGANTTLRPTIDDSKCLHATKGIECQVCARSCPQNINIRKPELSPVSLNNCTKCRECAECCPAHALGFPLLPKKQAGKPADGGEALIKTDQAN